VKKSDIRIKISVKYCSACAAYSTKLYFASFLVGYLNGRFFWFPDKTAYSHLANASLLAKRHVLHGFGSRIPFFDSQT
jgi:hypothetical protein